MRWLLLVLVPLLSSCAPAPVVERVGGAGTIALDELAKTVDEFGEIADRALARVEDILCAEHFSLRAYRKRYNTPERWQELRAFCQWDVAPPDPGGQLDDGMATDDR